MTRLRLRRLAERIQDDAWVGCTHRRSGFQALISCNYLSPKSAGGIVSWKGDSA